MMPIHYKYWQEGKRQETAILRDVPSVLVMVPIIVMIPLTSVRSQERNLSQLQVFLERKIYLVQESDSIGKILVSMLEGVAYKVNYCQLTRWVTILYKHNKINQLKVVHLRPAAMKNLSFTITTWDVKHLFLWRYTQSLSQSNTNTYTVR